MEIRAFYLAIKMYVHCPQTFLPLFSTEKFVVAVDIIRG